MPSVQKLAAAKSEVLSEDSNKSLRELEHRRISSTSASFQLVLKEKPRTR